jgi:hypothetical protein
MYNMVSKHTNMEWKTLESVTVLLGFIFWGQGSFFRLRLEIPMAVSVECSDFICNATKCQKRGLKFWDNQVFLLHSTWRWYVSHELCKLLLTLRAVAARKNFLHCSLIFICNRNVIKHNVRLILINYIPLIHRRFEM